MKKKITYILLIILSNKSFAQNFLNGNFENNSASICQLNLPNTSFNSFMSNCNAFGLGNEVDIQNISCGYAIPYSGNWFLSLATSAVGNPDAISITLSSSLIAGNNYQFSYFENANIQYTLLDSIQIGLSTSPNSFGNIIYSSLPIVGNWTQRIVNFIAPNNGNYITIKNAGNATGWNFIDDFSFCSINIDLGNDTTLCQGQMVTLNGGLATSYLWSNSSTASSIIASTSGTYWLKASNGQCSATDSITISINQYPTLNLGNDTMLCQGQAVTLNGGSATSFLWSNNSTASSINTSTSGTYWLQASNGQCITNDTLSILISNCEIEIELPNVFTPNSDGVNDNFIPIKYKGISKANLIIYNRWGEKLFYTENLILGWNGFFKDNNCSDGTYFWIVQYTTMTNESKELKGFLILIK